MSRSDTEQLIRQLHNLATTQQRVSSKVLLGLLAPHLPDRYSLCPRDREPLVSSLVMRGCEWVCVVCGNYYPMFGVPTTAATDQLHQRYWGLVAQLRAKHAEGVPV